MRWKSSYNAVPLPLTETRMSIELCVLASGSSGNCTVVRTPGGIFLIDIGIGPRTTAARLNGTGVTLADISAVCLTHLDRDHFNLNWIPALVKLGIRVFCAAHRVPLLLQLAESEDFADLVCPFDNDLFEPVADVSASTVRLAHDHEGSHAFLFEGFGTRVGFATDLGAVPNNLIERFCGVDLLAIESNYDPDMQLTSARPLFLKQRIMGGRGHLSNAQALAAVKAILDRCEHHRRPLPRHVLLLHRSRLCNCPNIVRDLFSRDHRLRDRLVLTEQYERTNWLSAAEDRNPCAGEQLAWAWA
jgi:phosphoribosyl 1,2-cyclic phosphodiesterase